MEYRRLRLTSEQQLSGELKQRIDDDFIRVIFLPELRHDRPSH